MGYRILQGDSLDQLATLPDESVQCVVTSPPYWGLRDYGVPGQLGLEKTPQEFIAKTVAIFREVRRVLRKDGTCWVNMGDSYATGTVAARNPTATGKHGYWENPAVNKRIIAQKYGLKPKDLCGMPWRLAFALQEDGWWLRQDIIWAKPNPMPESVTDRCTKAHEYLFLLTKSERYFYDAAAIKEKTSGAHPRGPGNKTHKGAAAYEAGVGEHRTEAGLVAYSNRAPGVNPKAVSGWRTGPGSHSAVEYTVPSDGPVKFGREGKNSRMHVDRDPAHLKTPRRKQNESFSAAVCDVVEFRNKRSVWEIATEPYSEAHFATFPMKLVEPCILAGSMVGDVVLDPFSGSGTTGVVALRVARDYVGIELNAEYVAMSHRRIQSDAPLFNAAPDPFTRTINGEEVRLPPHAVFGAEFLK